MADDSAAQLEQLQIQFAGYVNVMSSLQIENGLLRERIKELEEYEFMYKELCK